MPFNDENTYVIKDEGAELGRLILQDKLFTQAMGGLFPDVEPDGITKVLDLACGPAGWALEVAFQFPEMEVVGADISTTITNYNFAQAKVRNLQNITFEVMDVRKPLDFPDCSFDLVNGRFLTGFMDIETWPKLLAECKRILRPGGVIRLTEAENAISNSAASQELQYYLYRAFAKSHPIPRTYTVDGRSIGITHMLYRLLQEAGFNDIERKAFYLDSSNYADLHHFTFRNAEAAYALLKPFILKSGGVTEEEYDKLYTEMLIEWQRSDFTCLTFCLTAWARKPEE